MGRRKTVSLLEPVIVEGLREYPPSTTRGFTSLVVNYVNDQTGGRNLSPSQLTSWLQAARKRNQFPAAGLPSCFTGGPNRKDDNHSSISDDDGSVQAWDYHSRSSDDMNSTAIGEEANTADGVPAIAQQLRLSLELIVNPSKVSNSRETSSMDMDLSSPSQSSDPLTLNPDFPQLGDVVSSPASDETMHLGSDNTATLPAGGDCDSEQSAAGEDFRPSLSPGTAEPRLSIAWDPAPRDTTCGISVGETRMPATYPPPIGRDCNGSGPQSDLESSDPGVFSERSRSNVHDMPGIRSASSIGPALSGWESM
ncbi:hypothetical protein B0H14DRAFT_2730129 [Mycena olivaceomarginata]|nr:hypothetical protein B0H14DRAFT_2730129 [Mycena olivaceomarginata]